jgi:hypothetical protein
MSTAIEVRHTEAAAEWAASTDRTPVLTVVRAAKRPEDAGDDWQPHDERHEYTMPSKPNVGMSMAYLKQARQNADLAASWLIETAIGSDGYDALVDELAGLGVAEAQALVTNIAQRIQTVALGGLEAPKA